jgi:hypothetical protein
MKFNRKRLRAAAAVLSLCSASVTIAKAQKAQVTKPMDTHAQSNSINDKDTAYYKQFLDKDGGYTDKKGGHYNPTAGTYTDEAGGVVDNWGGYTYKSGSYKTQFGDYYDAKANVFKLTDGQTIKGEAGVTPAQAIQVMREDVEQRGGYDKEFTRKSMLQEIKFEHPNRPSK